MQDQKVTSQTAFEYDFDTPVDRTGTNSLKWNGAHRFLTHEQCKANPLPMWVADMDFKTAPAVLEALHAAIDHGIFGYSGVTNSYRSAVAGWQRRRFGWDVEPEWIVTSPGIITALKTILQTFTLPGDSVLIQPPCYVHFHSDVMVNGRHVAWAPLDYCGERYEFNAKVFEAAIRDNTKIFIMSNPHNPTGNVWSEDELRTMGEICMRHGVLVISDEVHQDFVLNPEKRHIPFASLGPEFALNSIVCCAASKTFNLAGLQCANLLIPDKRKRAEVQRTIERNLYSSVNLLGMVATEAAYTHGDAWVDALVKYIGENQKHFSSQLRSRVPQLKVIDMDSLYLAWVDCRSLNMPPAELDDFMLTQARVWFDKGQKFGVEGHGFLRANLGCPRRTVDQAIDRIVTALGQR